MYQACGKCIPSHPAPAENCHDGTKILANDLPTGPGGSCVLRRSAITMTHNTMTHNALSPESLRANDALLWAVAHHPLNSDTLRSLANTDADMRTQLQNVYGASLLKYIVSCALPQGASVDYRAGTPPSPAANELSPPWQGELGLCGGGSPYGDWATGAPSSACLQLVSSCVLARSNALGEKVSISVRGEPSCLFSPLRDEVPVETGYREPPDRSNPTFPDLPSFHDCTGSAAPGDATRNCGWAPLDVGRCQAGTTVTVCASRDGSAPASCDSTDLASNDLMLRVCKGLYGCGFEEDHPPYTGYLPDQRETRSPRPRVTFTCPNNGPLIREGDDERTGVRYGYYSVMVASTSLASLPRNSPDDARPRGIRANAFVEPLPGERRDEYPATEAHVFTYPEGAFYGYIFPLHPGQLRSCSESVGPDQRLSNDMYACYSELWTTPMAVLTDRYCAHPPTTGAVDRDLTQPCFVNAPMACYLGPGDRCGAPVRDPGAYRACNGTNPAMPPWLLPITVYLNHPCDLASNGNCEKFHAIGKAPGFSPPQDSK